MFIPDLRKVLGVEGEKVGGRAGAGAELQR